jgi:hypothetical protein
MSCQAANWGALKMGHLITARLLDEDVLYRVVAVTKRRVQARAAA